MKMPRASSVAARLSRPMIVCCESPRMPIRSIIDIALLPFRVARRAQLEFKTLAAPPSVQSIGRIASYANRLGTDSGEQAAGSGRAAEVCAGGAAEGEDRGAGSAS